MVRVVLGEGNPRRRRSLRRQLQEAADITVVGEAATHTAVAQLARSRRAQVVLTDLMLGGEPGIETIASLTRGEGARPVPVMVLTHCVERVRVVDALDNGASAYLVRPVGTEELIGCVRAVARGEVLIAGPVAGAIRDALIERGRQLRAESSAVTDRFSTAELDLLNQLSSGITSNAAIAVQLGLSVNTIRTQLQGCLRKTGLTDRTALALWAVRHGLNLGSPALAGSPEGFAVADSRHSPSQLGLEQPAHRIGVDLAVQHGQGLVERLLADHDPGLTHGKGEAGGHRGIDHSAGYRTGARNELQQAGGGRPSS